MPCCSILTGASIRRVQAGIPTHMREHRRGETRHDTGRQGDGEAGRGGQVGLLLGGHAVVDELCAPLVDCELTDGVRDLLGEDGDEAGVERGETLGGCDFGEARDEAGGVLRGESARPRGRREDRGGVQRCVGEVTCNGAGGSGRATKSTSYLPLGSTPA
jgi:hypothetical protein